MFCFILTQLTDDGKQSKENKMKIQYIKVNDFIISHSHLDGQCRYEKKSGSVEVGSSLSLTQLKYCLKHSKAHRLYLNEVQNYFLNPIDFEPSDEYKFYQRVKMLVEKLINFLEVRYNHGFTTVNGNGFVSFQGIKLIVDYGNRWIDAQDYQDIPSIPDVQFRCYIDTCNQTKRLIKHLTLYKIFTQKAEIV